MSMDLKELAQLTEIVRSSNIYELTLRQGAGRITVRQRQRETPLQTGDDWEAADQEYADDATETPEPAPAEFAVTATSVGIFHHVKPIVGLGAVVREGQVMGRIEAIKLMNDVTAEQPGTVFDVLVEDGQAVEYGQPLFLLHPAP